MSTCIQPVPRIWGVLILDWLVVNNYIRGGDHRHYVTKLALPSTWFSNVMCLNWFSLLPLSAVSSLQWMSTMHLKMFRRNLKLVFKRWSWWLHDAFAAIVTPYVVIHHQSVEYYRSPDSGDRLNKTECGCSLDPFRCVRGMGLGDNTTLPKPIHVRLIELDLLFIDKRLMTKTLLLALLYGFYSCFKLSDVLLGN